MVRARRFLGSRAWYRRVPVSRARRAAPRRRVTEDAGFTLMEIMIALAVLFLAITGIGLEMATQYSSVGSSRNEQTGQAILSRILNEARALPYTVVAKGLATKTTDSSVTTATFIKVTGSVWTLKDATLKSGKGTGEIINHYSPNKSSSPPPPFFPHKSCFSLTGAPVTPCPATAAKQRAIFTVRTFPTKYHSRYTTGSVKTWLQHVLRVTIIVTWAGKGTSGNNGSPTTLVGQTLIFSKTAACSALGVLTNPNPSACQPDFTADAYSGAGVIAVKPITSKTPVNGVSFTSFDLVLPGTYSTQTLTQTSTVLGSAQASGGAVAPTSSRDQETVVVSKASNDLATGTSNYQALSFTHAGTPLADTSSTSTYSITATPSSTDEGTTVSTTSATSTRACKNFTNVAYTTSLPCGYGKAVQGTTATLVAHLGSLGSATLASVATTASHTDRVNTVRYARSGVTTCPTTAVSGCVNAGSRGALGTVKLSGLPSGTTAPGGWLGYLVQVSGFHARATVWARSAKTYLKGSLSTVTGTISYWAGGSYKTVTIGSTAQSLAIPTVSTSTGDATITPHLVVGGASCTATTTSTHPSTPHVEKCSVSPLSGTITYVVKQGGTQVTDFTMTVGLGSVSATASYQEPT